MSNYINTSSVYECLEMMLRRDFSPDKHYGTDACDDKSKHKGTDSNRCRCCYGQIVLGLTS